MKEVYTCPKCEFYTYNIELLPAHMESHKKEQGIKHDTLKNRLDLLPFEALEQIGEVMTSGARKYGAYNWKNGMAWSRLLGAALRHIFAWAAGQDKDLETGLSHLAHAGCCILFLLTYEQLKLGEDDRWKSN